MHQPKNGRQVDFTMRVNGGTVVPLDGKGKYRCQHWQLRVPTGRSPRTGRYGYRAKAFRGGWTAAVEAHEEFRREVLRGAKSAEVIPTFEELAAEYAKHKRDMGNVTAESAAMLLATLKPLAMHLGKARCDKIDGVQVTEAAKALMAGDSPSGRKLSGTYIGRMISVAKSMYDYAIDRGYVAANPIDKASKPRNDTGERDALTDEAAAELLARLDMAKRQHVATAIALLSGMRRGELCALLWGDIDLIGQVATISKSMTDRGVVKTTKTGKTRIAPLSNDLTAMLLAWKETQHAAMDGLGVAQYDDTPVLANRFGSPLTPYVLTNWWRENRERLGVPEGFRFHDLRHTYSTMLARRGVHPAVMQRLMGHSSGAMTMHYTHADMSQERDAVNLIRLK